jgi:hypothetical protein
MIRAGVPEKVAPADFGAQDTQRLQSHNIVSECDLEAQRESWSRARKRWQE